MVLNVSQLTYLPYQQNNKWMKKITSNFEFCLKRLNLIESSLISHHLQKSYILSVKLINNIGVSYVFIHVY